MTKFHRNFIDFLTDHEKRVSDRQDWMQDGRLLQEPLAKHHVNAKNLMYSTLNNRSYIAHPLYNDWSYPHTCVPVYLRFILSGLDVFVACTCH